MKPVKKSLVIVIIRYVNFFLFMVAFFSFIGFLIGSFQGFLETTQLVLLKTGLFFGIGSLISALSGILIQLEFALAYKSPKFLIDVLGYILFAVIGILIVVFSLITIYLAQGNR